jgi:hypothetical protein
MCAKLVVRGGRDCSPALREGAEALFREASGAWLRLPPSSRDARGVSAILHAAVKLGVNIREMEVFLNEAGRLAQEMDPQSAASALWALARLQRPGPVGAAEEGAAPPLHPQALPLAESAVRLSHRFNAPDATMSVWAAACLGLKDPRVVLPLVRSAARRRDDSFARGQNAANSLWAVSKLQSVLGKEREELTHTLAVIAATVANEMKAEEVAMSLLALATCRLGDESLVLPLATVAARRAPVFYRHTATRALWAVAMLKLKDPELLRPLVRVAVGAWARDFDAKNAAHCLWALVQLRWREEHVLHAALEAALRTVDSATPAEVELCLGAVAGLDWAEEGALRPVAKPISAVTLRLRKRLIAVRFRGEEPAAARATGAAAAAPGAPAYHGWAPGEVTALKLALSWLPEAPSHPRIWGKLAKWVGAGRTADEAYAVYMVLMSEEEGGGRGGSSEAEAAWRCARARFLEQKKPSLRDPATRELPAVEPVKGF